MHIFPPRFILPLFALLTVVINPTVVNADLTKQYGGGNCSHVYSDGNVDLCKTENSKVWMLYNVFYDEYNWRERVEKEELVGNIGINRTQWWEGSGENRKEYHRVNQWVLEGNDLMLYQCNVSSPNSTKCITNVEKRRFRNKNY